METTAHRAGPGQPTGALVVAERTTAAPSTYSEPAPPVSSDRQPNRQHAPPHLEVAVDDLLLVAVGQRLRDVQHVPRPLGLGEAALLQRLVQLPARRELEDEVDALLVVEVAEQPQDIPMPAAGARKNKDEASCCVCIRRVAHAHSGGGGSFSAGKSHLPPGPHLYLFTCTYRHRFRDTRHGEKLAGFASAVPGLFM